VGEGGVGNSDLRFTRRGPQPIELPLGDFFSTALIVFAMDLTWKLFRIGYSGIQPCESSSFLTLQYQTTLPSPPQESKNIV
jgi:hypothetical protein